MIEALSHDLSGYDLCIIGAGPAGLSIAAELAYSGLKICVLESGGEERTEMNVLLNTVVTRHLRIKEHSRERMLGGAGRVWGGLSSTLDHIDLESREWCEGWPISFKELDIFLSAAQRFRFPHPNEFTQVNGTHGFGFTLLREKVFIAVRPFFDFARLKTVFQREEVDLFMHATATRLFVDEEGGESSVSSVSCSASNGDIYTVKARTYILACGGIENARILLHSDVGNEHDQVGRYFMNHPKGHAGRLSLTAPVSPEIMYLSHSANGRIRYAGVSLTEQEQRERGLLNSYVQFEPETSVIQRYVAAIEKRLPSVVAGYFYWLRTRTLRLRWYTDMEPRSENRIELSDKVDRNAVPLPVVSYQLGEKDKETLRALHTRLYEECERLQIGTLMGDADEVLSAVKNDASHHLGGARMGHDPHTSVVDKDCKVHSVRNLYVAGGSVFPTSGSANPTYTIVALAIRLAAHLRDRYSADVRKKDERVEGDAGVIVVGAGRRVMEDIIPALESLHDNIAIRGIYAPHRGAVFGALRMHKVHSLRELPTETRNIRFIYIAVPASAVMDVLRTITTPDPETELILDTPVHPSIITPEEKKRWKRVHVAEDSIFLPWMELYKDKKVKKINCSHSVYRYHGIALLRTLIGERILVGVRLGARLWMRSRHVALTVTEPRDYARGTLTINGTEPQIIIRNHRCIGFRTADAEIHITEDESRLAGYMEEGDTIVSRMPELKRVGLRRLIKQALRDEATWSLTDGFLDTCIDRVLHRFRLYVAR